VFAAARDITQRRRAEEAVRAERQRLNDLLEMLPVYVVLLSPDYHVPFANRFFRERFGESGGRRCFEYLFGRTEPCTICETFEVLKTNAPHHWEWTGPDGRNYDIFDYPFTDADGSPLILEMGIDITERKRAEAELVKHREHLEELVRQRTAELEIANRQLQEEIAEHKQTEQTLRRTAEDLVRSNRDLEQFAYVASHDLQEPLRMVTGHLQLLQRRYQGRLDAAANDFIGFAVDGATRMATLISDLLAYSRVGTAGGSFAPADCQAVLQRALGNLRSTLEDSQAVVTNDPLPVVMGEFTQLVQLFQNLLGNALKFRSQRRPEIHVGASKHQGEWLFRVRDNGIGIEPQYFDRIFMIFQRLHGREAYGGTGIGLAICKKVVERHGGRIWVKSQPSQGSTFYFTISQVAPEAPPASAT
jgi:signal transduction histidine kinase